MRYLRVLLIPCPGCGALFPPSNEPTHRYVGASAGCWALFNYSVMLGERAELIAESRIPDGPVAIPAHTADTRPLDSVFGDSYAVQHHGEDSPQAIQSVAVHLLNVHGIISGRTTQSGWAIGRALRTRGVFHKLAPPPPGSALTIRHLFSAGGVATPVTRGQYVLSVYKAWMSLHRSTVEDWYERYVVRDRV